MKDTITIREMIKEKMPYKLLNYVVNNFEELFFGAAKEIAVYSHCYKQETIKMYNVCWRLFSEKEGSESYIPYDICSWLENNNYRIKRGGSFTESEKEILKKSIEIMSSVISCKG